MDHYEEIIYQALEKCFERRVIGKNKYGDLSFMEKDNLEDRYEQLTGKKR